MKNERYLIEKNIVKSIKTLGVFISFIFLTGFYDPGSNYIKLEEIKIELGEKIPQDKLNYINSYLFNSNFILEDNVLKDTDGHTTKAGLFKYYVVYRDEERKYSRLTQNSATISVVDTIKPEIRIKNQSLKFNYGSKIKVGDIADCYDLSKCNLSFKQDINSKKEGMQEVTLVAIDESNNINEINVSITIKERPKYYSPSYTLMDKHNMMINSKLSNLDKVSLRNKLIDYAKQFVGNPYVYGGNSLTNGIDCSGFTKAIYNHFGYQIPRIAPGQGYIGIPVKRGQLLPGDLVVFHKNGIGYHVALYIGNNMIIHAGTEQTGIEITKLWAADKFYRRIIY